MNQPGENKLEKVGSKALNLMKEGYSIFKKDFSENFEIVKKELSSKMNSNNEKDIEAAFEYMTKYYMYVLNEASLGLYFCQTKAKKMNRDIIESKNKIDHEEVLEKLAIYNKTAKTIELETREIASLKDDWFNEMNANIMKLAK